MDNQLEQKLLAKFESNFTTAESAKSEFETKWEDDKKAFSGDHWGMSISRRSEDVKKRRPNSVDNLIFPIITYKLYILSSTTPEAVVTFVDEGLNTGKGLKMTEILNDILYKNEYDLVWARTMLQALESGPFINTVTWDSDMKGGTGPNRYNGEVSIRFVDIRDFYPDPAMTDLEQDLQRCEFIALNYRKKLSYFKKEFGEKGEKVIETAYDNEDERYEGTDAKMANLRLYYHKGKPEKDAIDDKYKEVWQEKMESSDDIFERNRYKSMIEGEMEGVHLALYSTGVLLDYKPYLYDDGKYPISYNTIHVNHDNQWGFGEIEQLKVPQIEHNKISEIQIEAFSKKGLGSFWYNKGSITLKQLNKIFRGFWKGGQGFEVNNTQGIKEITGTDVPPSLSGFGERKGIMVDKIGGYRDIQQGEAKSGTPYKLAELLGSNADLRTTGISKKAEIFHRKIIHFVVDRVIQFYDDGRTFKIRNEKGVFRDEYKKDYMMETWERETDEGVFVEKYFPEYDIKVKVMDEKPTNRQYNIELAFRLFEAQALDLESLLEIVETGNFVSKAKILGRLQSQGEGNVSEEEVMAAIQQLPIEQQQQLVQLAESNPALYQQELDKLIKG